MVTASEYGKKPIRTEPPMFTSVLSRVNRRIAQGQPVRSPDTAKSWATAAELALHQLFEPGAFDNRYAAVGGDILQFLHNS